ncbi:orotate phosphoribosyltransferase [Candidatus Berkiella aquae]|nr:orotate phosphoribosyltransferase [Candidatus Berkiella aquae]MCS5710055.1 orotate phosphoribosyltransferase [Candidatus Berkiella aquae]
METYRKTFIDLALEHNALRFGDFTLKSGRKSPYFFNAGQFNTGDSLKVLGECYAAAIMQSSLEFDVLFGPAYKGIPLATATAIGLNEQFQRNVPYCFNRKEAKDHGEGGLIVGAPLQGRALIIDDVVTAGTAIRESLQIIQGANATVAGIIVALDRQEKGQTEQSAIQEIESSLQVSVVSIITLTHIMEFIENEPQFSAFRKPMAEYRQQYGISSS